MSKRSRCWPNLRLLVFIAFSLPQNSLLAVTIQPATRTFAKSQISFPKQVGAFTRHGPPEKDERGYPEATYWAGALALASIFYYENDGQSLRAEYSDCKGQVRRAWKNVRVLSDQSQAMPVGGAKRQGYRGIFTLTGAGGVPSKSQLIAFKRGTFFLVFRITYPLSHADRIDTEIGRFLASFPWPGG